MGVGRHTTSNQFIYQPKTREVFYVGLPTACERYKTIHKLENTKEFRTEDISEDCKFKLVYNGDVVANGEMYVCLNKMRNLASMDGTLKLFFENNK